MSNWKNLIKRGFAVFLSLTLCLSLMNVSAFAEETTDVGSDDAGYSETNDSSDSGSGADVSNEDEDDAGQSDEDEDDAGQSDEDEDDAGQSDEDENDAGQSDEDKNDVDQSNEDKNDVDQPNEDKNDADQSNEDKNDADQSGEDKNDADQSDEDKNDADQSDEDKNDADQSGEETKDPAEGEGDAQNPAEGEGDAQNPAEGEGDAQNPAEGEGDAQNPAEGEGDAQNPAEGEGDAQLPEGILPGEEDLYQRNEDGSFVLDENGKPVLKPLEKVELPPELIQPPVQRSDAVQAFLDAAAQLPEEVTEDNYETVGRMLEDLLPLFQNLSEEEQELESVLSAYTQVLALWEQCEGVKAALLVDYPVSYEENNISYELYEDGTAKVVKGTPTSYQITIPASVAYEGKNYQVTVIGASAFESTGWCRKLILPEGLETIEDQAFRYVYFYANDLVIPDSVTSIGAKAFYGFHLKASDSYHINKITLGKNLRTIGDQAFYFAMPASGYYKVEVECYGSLESIHKWAFPYNYDRTNYIYSCIISTLTINGVYEGELDSVLDQCYGLRTDYGLERVYPMGPNPSSVTTASGLQKLINESEGPTTLTLNSRFLVVKDSIVVPAGKDITLTDNGTGVVLETGDYKFSKPMFIIEKGGKLTIDATGEQNLIINGAVLSKLGRLTAGIFQVNGELVLNNGLINGAGNMNDYGGYNGMFSGAIVLGSGAKFTMTGGTLRGTSTDGDLSAPVVVGSGAEFIMSGGTITENYNSTRGNYSAGAVLVYGWNAGDVGGRMTLTGDAVISGNSTRGVGGAITLVGNAELYMDGGVITDNKSTGGSSSNGGGVCVAGRTGGMSSGYDAKCVFTMDGGEISNNSANYGGGIYVNSNYVTLNAGEISGNSAWGTGGGVYVETPSGSKTGAKVNNAVITGNTATVMGGGMYFCPTGSVDMSAFEGVAVFDNRAGGAADDFVTVVPGMNSAGKYAKLAARMLGGGKVDWYRDGTVTETAIIGGWGWVTEDSVRFNAENPGMPVKAGTYNSSLALKAIVSEGAKELANEDAKLFITGNSAQRGGGIGANGAVTAGDVNREEWNLKVNAKKLWEGIDESEWEPVTFQLMIDGRVVETVTLSAENDWNCEFTGLPVSAKEQISIKEITGTYHVTYVYDMLGGATELTITVTNSPGGSLTITKAIQGGGDAALEKTYTFTVTGPQDYNQTVKIKGADSVTLSGLKPGSYTVKEDTSDTDIPGFNWTVDGDNATVDVVAKETGKVTITNIYEAPVITPDTGILVITKAVNGGGSAAREKVYTFTVTGPDGFSRTVTITGEGSVTLSPLTPGEYTVTEDRAGAVISGYTLSISGSGDSATVTAGGTANVTITNTYTTPGGGDPGDDDDDDPTPPPTPEIPEEDVPLTDIPEEEMPLSEIPEEPEELEIPEEEVPLADVPETGDLGGGWMMAMLMGALGMLWMKLSGKKRSEEEEG